MMLEYSKEIAGSYTQPVFDEVISKRKYSKSTIAFLREILNYYGRENNLSRHLSSLSTYKHPKMEALYEAARLPQWVHDLIAIVAEQKHLPESAIERDYYIVYLLKSNSMHLPVFPEGKQAFSCFHQGYQGTICRLSI